MTTIHEVVEKVREKIAQSVYSEFQAIYIRSIDLSALEAECKNYVLVPKGNDMDSLFNRIDKVCGLFPTAFHLGEMWRLNAARCGGRFNLFFFWLYPIGAAVLLPYTVLCLLEVLLTKEKP